MARLSIDGKDFEIKQIEGTGHFENALEEANDVRVTLAKMVNCQLGCGGPPFLPANEHRLLHHLWQRISTRLTTAGDLNHSAKYSPYHRGARQEEWNRNIK